MRILRLSSLSLAWLFWLLAIGFLLYTGFATYTFELKEQTSHIWSPRYTTQVADAAILVAYAMGVRLAFHLLPRLIPGETAREITRSTLLPIAALLVGFSR